MWTMRRLNAVQGRVVTLLAVMIATAGCDQLFMVKPEARDVVGVYRLTKSSEEWLRSQKQYAAIPDSRILLRSDSTVEIQNLPDCADDAAGQSRGKFLSARGKWQVSKHSPGYGIDLEDIAGSMRGGVYVGWIALRRRTPPYELELIVGDPDSGHTLRYARAEG
jgi:hypothetical protein